MVSIAKVCFLGVHSCFVCEVGFKNPLNLIDKDLLNLEICPCCILKKFKSLIKFRFLMCREGIGLEIKSDVLAKCHLLSGMDKWWHRFHVHNRQFSGKRHAE